MSVSTQILIFFGNYCFSLTFSSKPLLQLGIKRQCHKSSYGHIVFSVRKLIDQMLVMECEISLLLVTRALSSVSYAVLFPKFTYSFFSLTSTQLSNVSMFSIDMFVYELWAWLLLQV